MKHLDLLSLLGLRRRSNSAGQRFDSDYRDASPSCGWYDSSHDLKRGLEVIETNAAPVWPETVAAAWRIG